MTLPIGEDDDGEPAIAWEPTPRVPRPARAARSSAARRACPRARRSGRATAPRSPRARRGCPTSTRWRRRSPAASARRRPSARTSWPSAACPPARRSASPGSSASSTPSWPARPAASCWPAPACSRAPSPQRGESVRTTIDPEVQRRGGRGARRPLRRDRGGAPAHRRGARAGRRRVLGAAAARLGVQDHHARGSARGRRASSATRASRCRRRRRSRASQLAERQRRVVRRHADRSRSRTRATRSSRRWAPSSARAGSSQTAEHFGFNEEPGAGGRRALDDPGRRRDRRRPGGRLDRDRPGQGAHDPAGDGAGRGGDRRGRRAPASRRCARARRRRPSARSRRTVARFVGRSMRAVVTGGTGVGAAIDGVKVAGKTGTAELRTTVNEDPVPPEDGERRPAAGRPDRHRRLVRRLRAREGTRGSRSACC